MFSSGATTKAAIRIFTNESRIDFIEEALGVAPTEYGLRGQPVSTRRPGFPIRENSVYLLNSPLALNCSLDQHLGYLLTLIESRSTEVVKISNRLDSIDFFCMYSSESGQGSLELSSEMIKRMARLQVDVDIVVDLYSPEAPD